MKPFRPVVNLVALLLCLVAARAGAAEFELTRDAQSGIGVIAITGPIVAGDSDRFFELSEQLEHGMVFLESPGGDVQEGIWIAAEIALRRFYTAVVDGYGCHSICAVIWISGAERHMTADAEISVHAAYRMPEGKHEGPELAESGVANALIGGYLNELGMSIDVIRYFTTARPDQPLLPITPAIAQRLDIDVHVLDGDDFTSPADRPTPRLIARQAATLGAMATRCRELLGVDTDHLRLLVRQTLGRGHELFGGELFAQLVPEFTERARQEIVEQGLLGWCLRSEQTLREQGFDQGITGPSFNCARAGTEVEHAICRSSTLWAMDRAMSHIYGVLRDNTQPSVAQELLQAQRRWLAERDRCGGQHACLVRRYRARLADFGL